MQLAKKLLSTELENFDELFKESLKSEIPLLNDILSYVIKNKGKQIRPLFALLCARMGGAINEKSHRAALFTEILHTATLILDDIIDESMERRGAFSINALWKNKSTVWVGDYLFAKCLLLSLSHNDFKILEIFNEAVQQMINGELLQLYKSRKLNLDEEGYYKIIKGKTASFIAAACSAGASSTFEDDAKIEKMHLFGENVGIAFQIKDDLFDYGTSDVGKPRGNDIRDRKLTLPLIYTLNTCSPKLKKELVNIIKHKNKDIDTIHFVINEVNKAGGIQYTQTKMLHYRDEALKILHEFPESESRTALEELVRFTTDRTY